MTGIKASTLFGAYESARFTLKLYRDLDDKYKDRPEYEGKRFRQYIYFLGKFNQKLEANEKELEAHRKLFDELGGYLLVYDPLPFYKRTGKLLNEFYEENVQPLDS